MRRVGTCLSTGISGMLSVRLKCSLTLICSHSHGGPSHSSSRHVCACIQTCASNILLRSTYGMVCCHGSQVSCLVWDTLQSTLGVPHRSGWASTFWGLRRSFGLWGGGCGTHQHAVMRDICFQLELPFLAILFPSMENILCSVLGVGYLILYKWIDNLTWLISPLCICWWSVGIEYWIASLWLVWLESRIL